MQQPEDSRPDAEGETQATARAEPATLAVEVGGPRGPEPTRYGDWEKNGRCIDF